MKILIPTYLSREEIAPIEQMIRDVTPDADIFASCLKASASVNRNACLDQIEVGDIAIMLDDDIRGFYPGWMDDLLFPFRDPDVVAVSARLMNQNGTIGPTCAWCPDTKSDEVLLTWKRPHCIMPTAAIAFAHRGHRFDENLRGSGFEDNDWFKQYAESDPSVKFIMNNACRLIHLNEMKEQKGENWQHNREYFFRKWPQCRA